MNWVGGTMSRIRGRDDKKIQREFFEKKRYEKTLDSIPLGLQSPTQKKELSISQDLLSLQTVLQTHREDSGRLSKPLKQPNKLDLKPKVGQKRMISYELVHGGEGGERSQVTDGFQNLETPTSFLDLKRWRGENRPNKTLGMCKIPNLRRFQELEQTVYRREGVEVETEKENLPPLGERDSLQTRDAPDSGDIDVVLRRDETRGSIQWNDKVAGESNTSVADTKWLDFLYGCKKSKQQDARYIVENARTDMSTQFPSVHLPVASSHPLSPHLNPANLGYYEREDLMEFERMSMDRPHPGNSEDPLYLTLTSNKDSFKGYKRPRIESSIGFSSSVGTGPVSASGGRAGPGGYLDESVFTTPAEGGLLRPDGMLTENPLPQSRKVALRSIRDFVLERSPIEESDQSSVSLDGLEDKTEEADPPEQADQPTVSSTQLKEKSKFIAPFVSKNKSPAVLTTSSEEERPSSKSYDSFLHSLITSDENLKGKSRGGIQENDNIVLGINEVQEESCMMSIVKWKAKESNRQVEEVNQNQVDSVDNESVERRGSYAMESVSGLHCGDENVESSHLEVELSEREFDCGYQSLDEGENSTKLLSTHDAQGSDVEMNGREFEDLDSIIGEEQKVGTSLFGREECFEECDTSGFVNEIIKKAIDRIISSQQASSHDEKSLTLLESKIENASLENEFQNVNVSFGTQQKDLDKIPESNRIVIGRNRIMECKSLENIEGFDHVGLNNSPLEAASATNPTDSIAVLNRIPEEGRITIPVEYAEIAIQCSPLSAQVKSVLVDTAAGSPLRTDSKFCQSEVRSSDKDCQTEDVMNDKLIASESAVGTNFPSENRMLSQSIQTETHRNGVVVQEIQTDSCRVSFPSMTDSERASGVRNRSDTEEYENFILHQQQIILALEKEIGRLKLNSDNS